MHKAQALADGAREGCPGFLSVSCYRFYGHGRMDKSPYRSAVEEEEGRKRDPIARARSELVRRGIATIAELDAMDAGIVREMSATIDFAAKSPEPSLNSMFRDVYAPGEPEPEPVRLRLRRILADN
jgi:pyruvate dehydrogenase E1 component alpha subunit